MNEENQAVEFGEFTAAKLKEKPVRAALPVERVKKDILYFAEQGHEKASFYPGELSHGVIAGLIMAGFTVEECPDSHYFSHHVKW
jgi:hypothetical protein